MRVYDLYVWAYTTIMRLGFSERREDVYTPRNKGLIDKGWNDKSRRLFVRIKLPIVFTDEYLYRQNVRTQSRLIEG